jgi:hypothetical protein
MNMKTLASLLFGLLLSTSAFAQSFVTGVIPQYAQGRVSSPPASASIDNQGNFSLPVPSQPASQIITFTPPSGSPYQPFSLTVAISSGTTNITAQIQQAVTPIGVYIGLLSATALATNAQGYAIPGNGDSGGIPSGTTNQMLYYPSAGTIVTPLTLGTNLSITGGVLNASSTGATNFNALTSGTNTVAAMLVGTGSSLAATGSGTIAATSAPYSGLTGSVPTWNQSTTGNAATATTAATATNLASYPTICSGGQFSQGLSSGNNNCATPSSSGSSISGQTEGYAIEAATATTATGPFPMDDGVTLTDYVTVHKNLQVIGTGSANGQQNPEGTTIAGLTGADNFWSDSTAHRWCMNNNSTGEVCLVGNATAATSGHIAVFASNGYDVTDGGAIPASKAILGSNSSSQIIAGVFPWSCQPGYGDGLNAITAGTYLQTACYNDTGQTVTLTGAKCFTDNSGSSTVNATNGAGTGLLTGAITCSSSFAAGTQSGTTTIASGDYIKFTFVADGTSKQSTFVITGTHP